MHFDLDSTTGLLDALAHLSKPGPRAQLPRDLGSAAVEEVFSVYNVGTGTFDETGQYINLNVDMFDFAGNWLGLQTGVHVNKTPASKLPGALLEVPDPPPSPIDGLPVPAHTVSEWTKGLFTFADGSSILAQGPAWTHMVPMKDGAFLFMVTTAQVITKGTGVFEGVHGVKQGTGTTFVAPGQVQSGKFPAPGLQFEAKVIDTFRIVRDGFLARQENDEPSSDTPADTQATSTATAATKTATKRTPAKRAAASKKPAAARASRKTTAKRTPVVRNARKQSTPGGTDG